MLTQRLRKLCGTPPLLYIYLHKTLANKVRGINVTSNQPIE